MPRLGHGAQRLPRLGHQRVPVIFGHFQECGGNCRKERRIHMGSDLSDPAQQFGMWRGFLERIKPADRTERAAPVRSAFGQQFIQARLAQVILRRQISGEFFGTDIIQDQVQFAVCLDRSCDQIEHPPLRLDRLKLGVMQDKPHRP